ncbi:hypothetical protein EQG64_03000 [Streptomyces sp. S6]|nr:hypothetical protein EQG64_03000 [Streptomyces sp. S6]
MRAGPPLPAAGVLFLLGIGIGAAGEQPETVRTATAKAVAPRGPEILKAGKATVTAGPEPAPPGRPRPATCPGSRTGSHPVTPVDRAAESRRPSRPPHDAR